MLGVFRLVWLSAPHLIGRLVQKSKDFNLREVGISYNTKQPKNLRVGQSCYCRPLSMIISFTPLLLLQLLMICSLSVAINVTVSATWCSIYRSLSLLESAWGYFRGIY